MVYKWKRHRPHGSFLRLQKQWELEILYHKIPFSSRQKIRKKKVEKHVVLNAAVAQVLAVIKVSHEEEHW